jgi:sigma-B regulation protein RsbU (phosphoserine phosphatase)
LDPQGTVLVVNQRLSEILGFPAEELIGRHFTELLDPTEQRAAETSLRDALAKPVEGPRDYRVRTKDGGRKVVTVTSVPLIGPTCPRKLLVLVLDATDRSQTEEAILEGARRYCDLLTAVSTYTYSVKMGNGVPVETDHSPGCLSVTGYAPEDYLANPYLWIDMVHADDQDSVRQYVAQILAGDNVAPIEHRIVRRDGATRWLRDTIVPHYENGRLVRYDGLVEDITDRREAEAALRETEASLRAAQEIQAHLRPDCPPNLAGYDIAGASYPAAYTGGDYFDYLPLCGGRLGVVIGDVSGHGIGPALLMATLYAHLKSLVHNYEDLSDILAAANRFLASETDRFITVFFGQLDPATRTFAYASAGHPACYVLDASGAVIATLESTAIPLAVSAEADFPMGESVVLDPGDLVFLLTDGIIEAESPDGPMFGIERALDTVRKNLREPAQRIIERLYEAVREFSRPRRQDDDVTAVIIKVAGTRPQTARGGIG